MSIVLSVIGVAFGAVCVRLLIWIYNQRAATGPQLRHQLAGRDPYVIYAAILGMLLMLASGLFPQVQS